MPSVALDISACLQTALFVQTEMLGGVKSKGNNIYSINPIVQSSSPTCHSSVALSEGYFRSKGQKNLKI